VVITQDRGRSKKKINGKILIGADGVESRLGRWALLKYMAKKGDDVQDILDGARAAGVELANTGKIGEETLKRISQEFISRDEYIKMINNNFEGLLSKYEG